MLKYNWQVLNNYALWKPEVVCNYFKERLHIIPRNKDWDTLWMFHGYSFILNPYVLLSVETNTKLVHDYIHLASLRSLFDYNLRGVHWVDAWRIPDQIDYISNPLIRIEDNKVFLKYETQEDNSNGD